MKDLESRIIEFLLADTVVKAITTDIKTENPPTIVSDKTITVKVNYESTHPVFDSEQATIVVKVWVNTRNPTISSPIKTLKDLTSKVITSINRTGDTLTKLSGGYSLIVYSIRKLSHQDELIETEKVWYSIITFEVTKNQ